MIDEEWPRQRMTISLVEMVAWEDDFWQREQPGRDAE